MRRQERSGRCVGVENRDVRVALACFASEQARESSEECGASRFIFVLLHNKTAALLVTIRHTL